MSSANLNKSGLDELRAIPDQGISFRDEENAAAAGTHTGLQHIGFKLYTEEFLLPVNQVREIIMLPNITYVPHSDLSLEGIIALRGEIMPVLNVRRLLGFPKGAANASTRVIIVQLKLGCYGMLVDEITDFAWLEVQDIENIAQNFFSAEYRVLSGVAKQGERVRGIMDIAKLATHIASQQDQVGGAA